MALDIVLYAVYINVFTCNEKQKKNSLNHILKLKSEHDQYIIVTATIT